MNAHPDLYGFADDDALERTIDQLCDEYEAAVRAGGRPRIEDYLGRVAELAQGRLLRELIMGELELRRARGETPAADEYLARFPARQADIEAAFAEDRARGESGSPQRAGAGREREDPPTRSFAPGQPCDAFEASLAFEPDDSHVGRYRLQRLLGKGGFGEVYLAHDEELDRSVAIKIPHPRRIAGAGDVDAYLAEARVSAQLDHPRIVPVYDFGRTRDGRCFIVSKYIEGTSLAERLRGGLPGREEAIELVAAVAEALHHAHLHKVVHRDVKPGNILLDAAANPYLTDFGLALREGAVEAGGHVVGTITYLSPEQARGEGHRVDGRSDVFSLCVVLYELLTGHRPFAGDSVEEIREKVAATDPPSPRQYDETIPRELERICLKGLARRIADRYGTARELAADLLSYLHDALHAETGATEARRAAVAPPPQPASELDSGEPLRIVPKGLRAFGAEDAEFFVNLLPGPRDRQGLPPGLSFWKCRIETGDPDETFPVGVMYGPSGCGKTSLVRAGLLPRLADRVQAIVCEADPATTESRLLRRIRFFCPGLASGWGLKESLAALRRDSRARQGRKVLLVLDQFEQWLHAHPPAQRAELIEALRQCDGRGLACLILVRDDFWLAVSRFLGELEVPLVEGGNAALVDLFDARHARRVLCALGRAYGALTPGKIARPESAFLDEAVRGLSEEGRVVCVRLALFAEMMRHRPWTLESLRSMGGVTAVGSRFLEETFAGSAAPPEHRLHEQAARAVLESLLPDDGSQIRGRTRCYAELARASGYAAGGDSFRRLLQILDRELRLVAPVVDSDPQPGESEAAAVGAEAGGAYQLTHDYLVPAVRDWVHEKRVRTMRGRAELRLAECSRRWQAAPQVRQLPSWWEWLRIRGLTRSSAWSEPQRRLMRAAGRRYLWRAAILGAATVLGFAASREVSGRYQAAAVVERLLSAETADVPTVVSQLAPYYRWAAPRLTAVIDDPAADSRRRLHASLALLPIDPSQSALVRARLLDGGPEECRAICSAIAADGDPPVEEYWEILADARLGARARFRAACALAAWAPADRRWHDRADEVAAWLVSENALSAGRWLDILKPVAPSLTAPLEAVYVRSDRQDLRNSAVVALAEYHGHDWRKLLALSGAARPPELPVLAAALVAHRSQATAALRAALARPAPPEASETAADAAARQRARAGLLLCLAGEPDAVWPYLAQAPDPRLRTFLVHGMAGSGVEPALLESRLASEEDASVRRAILWSLGQYEVSVLTRRRCEELAPRLREFYRSDPDPGMHSAAEWVLRKWGHSADLAEADGPMEGRDAAPGRGWYRNRQGQTLAIVRGPVGVRLGSPAGDLDQFGNEPLREERIDRSFAIATTEVTLRQYRRCSPQHLAGYDDARALDSPASRVLPQEAMAYCRWLTEQEGFPEEAMCYAVAEDGHLVARPDYLSRTGYRLATETEWECACRAGTTTRRHFGHGDEYLASYAWYLGHGDGAAQPVGLLLPNDLGLFDVYGNVQEMCHEPPSTASGDSGSEEPAERRAVLRGGDYLSSTHRLRSSARIVVHEATRFPSVGFRLARTLPHAPDTPENR